MKRSPLFPFVFLLASPAVAQSVDLRVGTSQEINNAEVAFNLDVTLTAVDETRLEVDALLDLQEFQENLRAMTSGLFVLDNCGLQVELQDLQATTRGSDLTVDSAAIIRTFKCERTGDAQFTRGEVTRELPSTLTSTVGVSVQNNCAAFELSNLSLETDENFASQFANEQTLEEVNDLVVGAIDLVVQQNPICPTLPEELSALAPTYDAGGVTEIGDGGVGVALEGTVDVSVSSILDLLSYLQAQDVLPPPP